MNSSTGIFSSPLATAYQANVERCALRIIDGPRVAEARARELMATHPLAAPPGAAAGIDRVLDKWLVQLTLQTVGGDVSTPGFIWGTNLTDYHWFGHDFPGSATAIDCPDNIYRNAGLDGAVQYQVSGQVLAGGPAHGWSLRGHQSRRR